MCLCRPLPASVSFWIVYRALRLAWLGPTPTEPPVGEFGFGHDLFFSLDDRVTPRSRTRSGTRRSTSSYGVRRLVRMAEAEGLEVLEIGSLDGETGRQAARRQGVADLSEPDAQVARLYFHT